MKSNKNKMIITCEVNRGRGSYSFDLGFLCAMHKDLEFDYYTIEVFGVQTQVSKETWEKINHLWKENEDSFPL
jgi:hypothetical protein